MGAQARSEGTIVDAPMPTDPADTPTPDPLPARGGGAAERMVEALLFAAAEPLSVSDLARRLPEGADVAAALAALARRYEGRGVRLWSKWPAAGASRPPRISRS